MKQLLVILLILATSSSFCQNISVSKDTLKFMAVFHGYKPVSDSFMVYNSGSNQLRITSIEPDEWWDHNLTYIHDNKVIRTGSTRRNSNIFPIDVLPKDSIKIIVEFIPHVTKSAIKMHPYIDSLFINNNSLNKNKLAVITVSDYPVDVEEKKYIPTEFNLLQNYPNPFNPKTVIGFSISINNNVLLEVYDLLGRRIVELFNGYLPIGDYEIEFDGKNLASGIYYYKIVSGRFNQTKKMLLLK